MLVFVIYRQFHKQHCVFCLLTNCYKLQMFKNLSVWNRLFIVFAVLWTIFSIVILTDVFRGITHDWHDIEVEAIEKEHKPEELTKSSIRMLMKQEKRDAEVLFFQLWVFPIVLVYCLGQITGWIIKECVVEKAED